MEVAHTEVAYGFHRSGLCSTTIAPCAYCYTKYTLAQARSQNGQMRCVCVFMCNPAGCCSVEVLTTPLTFPWAALLSFFFQRKKSRENAEKTKKVRDLMSLMGVNAATAEGRLEQCGWDYEKAATAFLETVN